MGSIKRLLGKEKKEFTTDEKLEWYAQQVFPGIEDDKKGSFYRRMVLKRFWERRGNQEPKKLDDGTVYRSEDMSRLDRTVNDVASISDRMENTIQSQVIYQVYNGTDKKEQFLSDLLKIENLVIEDSDELR
jgi:hypothetical protein